MQRRIDDNAVRQANPKVTEKLRKKRDRKAEQLIKLDEKALRKSKRKSLKFGKVAGMIFSSAIVFTLLAFVIQGQVVLTELTYEITEVEAQLAELQGTEVQLQMQAAGVMDATEIEEYVKTSLSMEKVNDYQITYINISSEDKGVVYEEETDSFWGNILEFLGL